VVKASVELEQVTQVRHSQEDELQLLLTMLLPANSVVLVN